VIHMRLEIKTTDAKRRVTTPKTRGYDIEALKKVGGTTSGLDEISGGDFGSADRDAKIELLLCRNGERAEHEWRNRVTV